MKVLCALLLAAPFACATGSSSSGSQQTNASKLDAQACAPMIPAVASRGSEVYDIPDSSNGKVAERLKEDMPVCASPSNVGYGLRRVKLANGKTGYTLESNLSN